MNKVYGFEQTQELLIKSLLAQPDSVPVVSEEISSEDFSNEKLKAIYKAILELQFKKTPLTSAEIFKFLKYNEGINLLEQDLLLFDNPPIDAPYTLAQLLKYNSVVNDVSKLTKEVSDSLETSSNPLDVMGNLQSQLTQYTYRLADTGKRTMEDEMQDMKNFALSEDELGLDYVVPTPYETLNKHLRGGFHPEQLISLGARPGVGKTVVATQCTAIACALNKSVLYFSLEVSKTSIFKRLIACYGNILLNSISPSKNKSDDLINLIKSTLDDMKHWKLRVVDDADVTIEKVRAIAQQTAQSESGLDFVVIDYLGLMSTRGLSGKTRAEMIAEISRNCKMLAKELKIPVLVLLQLKRPEKTDPEDKIPSMDDIKESSAMSADSDIVLILHRIMRDSSTDPKAMLILDKQRDGVANRRMMLRCVLEKNIFQDLKDESGSFDSSEEESVEEIKKESKSDEPPTDFGSISDTIDEWEEQDTNIDFDNLFDD